MPAPRSRSGSGQAQRTARLSRLVARVLRHRPEEFGIGLDPAGFVSLDVLAGALAKQPGWETISTSDLVALAAADPRRYEIQDGRIRARYGHTVSVEQPGEPAVPPEWLYYGTTPAEVSRLATSGLHPTGRQHVHLSTTPQAAREVGRRHAPDAVVVVVFARRAADRGIEFRRAGPDLYLTTHVPPDCLLLE
ncbi:MAG: RNA 2'-phosphotransferase [Armatimonadota bacterium]|nr:RNA 2'-phosphotransferase [Armatimonadota bacterium]